MDDQYCGVVKHLLALLYIVGDAIGLGTVKYKVVLLMFLIISQQATPLILRQQELHHIHHLLIFLPIHPRHLLRHLLQPPHHHLTIPQIVPELKYRELHGVSQLDCLQCREQLRVALNHTLDWLLGEGGWDFVGLACVVAQEQLRLLFVPYRGHQGQRYQKLLEQASAALDEHHLITPNSFLLRQ